MGKKKENNEIMLLVDTVNGYIRSEKKVWLVFNASAIEDKIYL